MRTRPMEFPGRLKQLKELDNSGVFNPIDNNSDHFRVKRGDRTPLLGSPEALLDLLLHFLLWYSSELVCWSTRTTMSKSKRQRTSTVFSSHLDEIANRFQQDETFAAPCV